MKVELYILAGVILMAIIMNLGGCYKKKHPFRYTTMSISVENYNEEEVLETSESLGLRPVDYLHYLNNPLAIQPPFEIFGLHQIPEGTAREQLNALDEFQASPCLTPPCNCGRGGFGWRGFKGRLKCLPFTGAREAGKRQEQLEIIAKIQSDYRYEVRIVNPSRNELLHSTNKYNDAYEYVVDYSSAHSDLVIYDLKTGESFEETP